MTKPVRTIIVAWLVASSFAPSLSATAQAYDPSGATADETGNRELTAEVDRGRIEDLVTAHKANDRLQTERPEWTPEPVEVEPRKRNAFLEAIADFFSWLFRTFGGLFKFIMIAVIGGAILYALWYMFGDVVGLRWFKKDKPDEAELSEIENTRPDRKQAVALLEQADALAAEGKFAEAVHLLLFRSIEDLQEKRSGGVPKSLTAREIQSLSDLSQVARQALAPIIRIVETSFFGGRPVDRSGWQTARQSYENFAFGGVTA